MYEDLCQCEWCQHHRQLLENNTINMALNGKWSDSEKLPPEKSQMRGRYRNTWYWCMDEIIGEYHAAYRLYEKGKWKC